MVFDSFRGRDEDGDHFDSADSFVPANIPEPGPFLNDHDVLTDERHLKIHSTAEEIFEERGVYDMTFGYNLAKLNLDTRHPDAGFRYAQDATDDRCLRVEFTPTTAFCPQSDTLTKGAYRAWNGLKNQHEFESVRIRVNPMHNRAETINEELAAFEEKDELPPPDSGVGEEHTPGSGDENSTAPF